jgi:glycosyltransferase involved in cell wall biosynthesis
MTDVALATKVFSRADKLGALLESAGAAGLDAVYVADDGEPSDRKDELYAAEYPFDLTVLDLEYDAGLGRGRNRIVEASDAEYLLVVDSDHRVPGNVETLVDQAEARPDLGGVSGLLYEDGKIRGTCHDLHERGDLLVRDVREDKPVEMVAGAPLVEFDFLPNVVLLRRECLEEQAWDDEYVIGKEHLDFYVAHAKRTDWRFAVSPTVLFEHRPGGDEGYVSNRESAAKLEHSKEYFLEKWGYRQVLLGQTDWTDGTRRQGTPGTLLEWGIKRALLSLPPAVQAPLMDARDAVRRRRNRPPL